MLREWPARRPTQARTTTGSWRAGARQPRAVINYVLLPAAVATGSTVSGNIALMGGGGGIRATTVNLTATDPSGNTATAIYEVDQAATAKTFTYDAKYDPDGMNTGPVKLVYVASQLPPGITTQSGLPCAS